MYYIHEVDGDNCVIKDTESNEVGVITKENLVKSGVKVLGLLKYNEGYGFCAVNHQPEDNILQRFIVGSREFDSTIRNNIESEDLREFASLIIRLIPDYFFSEAASSSGKYHPASNIGDGGLARHTVFVCSNLLHFTDIKSTRELFQLTQREIDLMVIACLMHDSLKHGWEHAGKTISEHPIQAATLVQGMVDFLDCESLQFIAKCIMSHMGQWNKNKKKEVIMPEPNDKFTWFVHLADYMASRRDISMTIENKAYVKESEEVIKVDKVNNKKIREAITVKEESALRKALNEINTGEIKISKELKDKLGISRGDDEVRAIWENIMRTKGVTKKQKKYISLAEEIWG